jgi:hypothetical protein
MDKPQIKINNKTTKQEIIDAYEALIEKMKDQPRDPKQESVAKQTQEKVEKASTTTVEKVLTEISNFKSQLSTSLDSVSKDILNQLDLFNVVKSAVEAEQKRLKDIYDIEINLDSLASLISGYKIRENELLEKYRTAEENYNKKCDALTAEYHDKKRLLDLARTREEEEYTFRTKFNRKKEEESFEYNKSLKLKELSDREAEIASKEEEYEKMAQQVASFPDQLNVAVSEAKKEVAGKMSSDFYREKEAMSNQFKSEQQLNDAILNSVKTKSEEQAILIQQLNERLVEANNQVQTIAVTAINGAQQKVYTTTTPEPTKK